MYPLVGGRAGVLGVGALGRVRVPLDTGRPGEQPARDVRRVAAARMAAPHGQARVAVDDVDGVRDLLVERLRGRVGVLRGDELLLGDPDALDEVQRGPRVAPVVRGQRVVEGGAQDRVDAHHAGAEVLHAGQPAVVVAAGRRELAGAAARHGHAEVHSGPEAGGERPLVGQREVAALDAGRERQAAALQRRPGVLARVLVRLGRGRGGVFRPAGGQAEGEHAGDEEQAGTHSPVLDADPGVLKARCQRSARATEIASGRPSIVTGSPAAPSKVTPVASVSRAR